MKLKIEHLKGYLGTGLELARADIKHKPIHKLHFGQGIGSLEHILSSDVYKPLLYPLSSLTEFREDLGFVPLEELGMTLEKTEFGLKLFEKIEGNLNLSDDGFKIDVLVFMQDIQKLYEWHIDIHNLIENNLAIDKTTIKL